MLPLGPTGYGNSPYMGFSVLAGNPLLISPEKLVEDKFLSASELFSAVKAAFGALPVMAEDLRVITPEVEAWRDTFGFPGMRILQ